MLYKLYEYARRVCAELPDLYRDDVIQECIISTWMKMGTHAVETPAFLMRAVQLRAWKKRYEYRQKYGAYEPLEEWHRKRESVETDVIVVTQTNRELCLAMIENNYILTDAAASVGMSLTTACRRWQECREVLREEVC